MNYILDTDMAIYRITEDGKVFSQPKRKIPIVGKGMEFTGQFHHLLGEEIELTTRINNRGYITVSILKTTKMVHRLVAEGFCENPEGKPFVNHVDGCKTNNHFTNLEWVTVAENNAHARRTGLHVQARGHTLKYKSEETKAKAMSNLVDTSSLTPDEVRYCRKVCKPRSKDFSVSALSTQFGVSVAAMSKIIRGDTYRDVK